MMKKALCGQHSFVKNKNLLSEEMVFFFFFHSYFLITPTIPVSALHLLYMPCFQSLCDLLYLKQKPGGQLPGSGAGAIRTQTSKPRPPLLQLCSQKRVAFLLIWPWVPLFTGQYPVLSAADKGNTLHESTECPGIWSEVTLLLLCGPQILTFSKTQG